MRFFNFYILYLFTPSGNVNCFAIKTGSPTSVTFILMSGDITLRHAKLTLFPYIFILNKPSFLSNNYLIPLYSESENLEALEESKR